MSISFRPCQTIPEDQDVVEDVVEGSFARKFLFVDFVRFFEFFFCEIRFFSRERLRYFFRATTADAWTTRGDGPEVNYDADGPGDERDG